MKTTEEKAKAYDKAIERANSLLSVNQLGNAWIYKLLPELKEDDDERIMKVLRERIIRYDPNNEILIKEEGISQKQFLDWVEKQGEHKKFRDRIQVGDKVTRNRDGMLVNLSQLNRVAKKDENQGQTFTKKDVDDAYLKGICDAKHELEKQGEKKPAWSEEDYNEIETIACHLDNIGNGAMAESLLNIMNKYKSCRPQNTWKPSDEQMHYLYWIANIKLGDSVVEQEVSKHLNELYQDLKKLREE